jgi:hypothetical protein
METALYTIVMEYLGGNYSSQVKAKNEREAIRVWILQLDLEKIEGFSEKNRQKLIESDFEDHEPVPINGLKNIWCRSLRIKKKENLALVNIIKTVES